MKKKKKFTNTGTAWKKKEKKDSRDFGGQMVKGSGNSWANPGDVKTIDFLIEVKQTDKKSYSVSLEKWQKISDEALFSYRIPLMSILIKDVELIIMEKGDFLKLLKQTELIE